MVFFICPAYVPQKTAQPSCCRHGKMRPPQQEEARSDIQCQSTEVIAKDIIIALIEAGGFKSTSSTADIAQRIGEAFGIVFNAVNARK